MTNHLASPQSVGATSYLGRLARAPLLTRERGIEIADLKGRAEP